MKKISLLLSSFLILFSVFSCTNSEKESQDSQAISNASTEVPITELECQKKNSPTQNFSFRKEIDKVKIGFYTYQTIRKRGVAEEADVGKTMNFKRFDKIVELEGKVLEQLYSILLNYTDGEMDQAHCYEPRHCLWFEDTASKVLSFVEICFACHTSIHAKNGIPIKCAGQLYELESFIASLK